LHTLRQYVPIIKTSYYRFITSIYRPNIIIDKSVFFILLSWFITFIMKKLSINVTEKQYYLLSRIAKSDDRRLQDLLYLIFSLGLSIYFCERSVYISKDDDEFTEDEKKQKAINEKLIQDTERFHHLSEKEQKDLGFKQVELGYSNYSRENDFIEKLADEIKENALKQINLDNQKIKDEIIKEDTLYKLVAGSDEKSIINGDSFKDSEVKKDD